MHKLQQLAIASLVLVLPASAPGQGPFHPDIQLEFGQFIPGESGAHTDTHLIRTSRPLRTLSVSMVSSGDPSIGEMHLPGSRVLLDVPGAVLSDLVNTTSELSFSAFFSPALAPGAYPVTSVEFGFVDGDFHDTLGRASGLFADGESFEIQVFAGFVPEPTSAVLMIGTLLGGIAGRRRRRAG